MVHDNSNGDGSKSKIDGIKPAAALLLAQAVFGWVNIFYKLALNNGMNVMVLVAYRCMFAAAALCPLAYFVERKKRPKMTLMVLLQTFCCGLFGVTITPIMFVASLKMTSATFTTAMSNLVPAAIFVLAVLLRLEKLGITTRAGQAKIAGTVVGIGGAMVLTFYKGAEINIWSTGINLLKNNPHQGMHPQEYSSRLLGSLLAVASCLTSAVWMIIQAKTMSAYPCCYSVTALTSLMGSVQATIVALCFNKDMSQWKLGFDIRLLTVAYSGIVASGLTFTVVAWCIQKRGPLYASVFSPLMLVIVVILGTFLLDEKLHVGSIIGTVLIILGLYLVLWGKGKEAARVGDLAMMSAKEPSKSMRKPLDAAMADGVDNL